MGLLKGKRHKDLRFDQRSRIGIRFAIERRQDDGQGGARQEEQHRPGDARPEPVLRATIGRFSSASLRLSPVRSIPQLDYIRLYQGHVWTG